MNKNILIILIVFISLINVNAFTFIPPVTEEENYNIITSNIDSYQTNMLYEDIWNAYLSGNISRASYNDLVSTSITGISAELFVAGQGEKQFVEFYEDLTSSELQVLKKILIENSYINPGDDTIIDEYISIREKLENKTYSKYLEYESLKNLQKENINSLWIQIISFTQLVIEILNILIYLLGFYLFVFIVIEAIPNAFIYMRDKIISNYLSKRGYRK